MNLYYKVINEEDYKELDLEKEYDINNIIIKIVSNFDIEEVEFEDEIFLNKKKSKEIVIHKLRTNAKAFLSFSIKYNQNLHRKVKRVNLTLTNQSKVYNIDEIKNLDEMYKITRVIAEDNFYDDFLSIYTADLNENFNDNEYREKLRLLNYILKIIIEIGKNLKVELITEEELRDSNEVKIISSTAAKYFIVHPEDWYREGNLMPKPIRLLTDVYLENKDIYENRFIRLVLFKVIIFIKSEILKLENFLNVYRPELERKKSEIELEGIDINELSKTISVLNKNISIMENLKKNFEVIKNKFVITEKNFEEVKLIKNLPIKMTGKISYDHRYSTIYKSYQEIKDRFFDEKIYSKLKSTEKTYYKYLAVIINSMVDAFKDLQFIEFQLEEMESEDFNFFEKKLVNLKGSTALGEYFFQINVNSLEDNNFPIELLLSDSEGKRKEINFNVNMGNLFNSKDDIKNNISNFYKKDSFKNNFITIVLESFKNLNCEFIDKEDVFKLVNLGNNFISDNDYKEFGQYKRGVMLFSLSDYVISKNRFKNLFLDNLAKLSYGNFCFKCSSTFIEQIDEEFYLCKDCGSRVAINKCSCGEKIVKVLSREGEGKSDKAIDKENIEEVMEYHNHYDLQSNYLGSCYGNLHSNSGGFCASCGNCLKKTKGDCVRCNLFEKNRS